MKTRIQDLIKQAQRKGHTDYLKIIEDAGFRFVSVTDAATGNEVHHLPYSFQDRYITTKRRETFTTAISVFAHGDAEVTVESVLGSETYRVKHPQRVNRLMSRVLEDLKSYLEINPENMTVSFNHWLALIQSAIRNGISSLDQYVQLTRPSPAWQMGIKQSLHTVFLTCAYLCVVKVLEDGSYGVFSVLESNLEDFLYYSDDKKSSSGFGTRNENKFKTEFWLNHLGRTYVNACLENMT